VIVSIRERGRLPVLVGGTGLYLRGLLKGIVEAPGRDRKLRARLVALAARHGTARLHGALARVDPGAAARVRPGDRQRIVRALEVYLATRRGLSELIRESPFGADRYASVKIGLSVDRDTLYRVIDARGRAFLRGGAGRGGPPAGGGGLSRDRQRLQGARYRETLCHLRGELSLEEAIALTKRNTRGATQETVDLVPEGGGRHLVRDRPLRSGPFQRTPRACREGAGRG